MLPFPPQFELMEREANRVKIRVWDAKKKKLQFIARIAEIKPMIQNVNANADEPSQDVVSDDVSSQVNVLSEGKDVDEEKHDELVALPDAVHANKDANPNMDVQQEDEDEEEVANANEEYKYNDNKVSKAQKHKRKRNGNNKRSKEQKMEWTKYPLYKGTKDGGSILSNNKFNILIDKLQPNTKYCFQLRARNAFGWGEWTKRQTFSTEKTNFMFASCIIDAKNKNAFSMKNALHDILCKQLMIRQFSLKRLFCSLTDGFLAKTFHAKCDNVKRTVLIGESECGQIFGGYTGCSWTASKEDQWKNDGNAFLFLLRNGKKQCVKQVFECIDPYNATRSNLNSGPCFGQGFDLLIADKCNTNSNSYSMPKSYNLSSDSTIGGKKNFKIKNYEIYAIV